MNLTPRWRLAGLILSGCLQLCAWGYVRHLGDLSLHIHQLWWALVPILAGYGLAAWLLHNAAQIPRATLIICAVALCSRLILLDTTPSLSDDIYRYLWDGRVHTAGLNPYAHAPDDETLTRLRDDDWSRVNHPELVTVYPPVAQWFFYGVYLLAPSVTGMKASLVVCDLLLILVLWRWLKARGQQDWRVLLYAWHPLPVLEIAGNGHVDILGVLWLCIGLLWLRHRWRLVASWALAAAVLSKMIPLLCVGVFWQRLAPAQGGFWRRTFNPRPRLMLIWVPVLVVAAYLVFADAGAAMCSGLSAYATKWRANDSAFGVVYALLSDPKPGWEWDDEALLTARWLCLGLVALVALGTALRRADAAAACSSVLGAQLLLAPTVHPWYLLWLLPFLVLRATPAWIAFSWLVLLAYEVHGSYRTTGVWQESEWIRMLEYLPVYLLLLWGVWTGWRSRPRNADAIATSAG